MATVPFLPADVSAPTNALARDFFFGFLTIALLGLAALIYGLLRIKRERIPITRTRNELLPQAKFGSTIDSPRSPRKIWARSRGADASFHETLAVRDVMPGLRARDPEVMGFAIRGGGLAVFVLFGLLAVGAGIQAFSSSDDGSGWVFVAFVIFFVAVQGYRVFRAARSKQE